MKNKILMAIIAILVIALTMTSALAASLNYAEKAIADPDLEAPKITSTPITTASVGTQYTYQVRNTPPDNGIVQYNLKTAPSGMTISSTGLITWTPSTGGNSNIVTVNVSDMDSSDVQTYTLTVSAQEAQFDAGSVEFGSESQKRNENLLLQKWTVKNVGSTAITNMQLSLAGVNSRYNLSASLPSTSLNGGQSLDVSFNLFVPEDQDAGRTKIGSVQLSGNGASSIARDIFLTVENNLEIKEIEVSVDGKEDKMKSPGTVDEDAQLGDEIIITVTVENTFDENIEIEDIELETEADDLDDADGLDDSISSLEDGDEDDLTVSFTIDKEDVDPQDAPFTITIKVTGEDENGALHGEEWDIKLDMDSETKDIKILDATMASSAVSCTAKTIAVNYRLRNVGSKDTNDAMVKFEVPELNIGAFERNIELDEGDSDDFTTTLNIPSSAKPGIYILEMTAYATDSTSDDTDEESLSFEIKSCSTSNDDEEEEEEEEEEDDENINVNNGGSSTPAVTGVPVSTSQGVRESIFGDNAILFLGIIVIILLIAVLVLAVKLARN